MKKLVVTRLVVSFLVLSACVLIAGCSSATSSGSDAATATSSIPLNTTAEISAANVSVSNGICTPALSATIYDAAAGCTGSLMVSGTSASNTYGTDSNIDIRFTPSSAVNMSASNGLSVLVYVPAGTSIVGAQVLLMNKSYAALGSGTVAVGASGITAGSWYTITIPAATLSAAANTAITSAVTYIDVLFQTSLTGNVAGVACTGYVDLVSW